MALHTLINVCVRCHDLFLVRQPSSLIHKADVHMMYRQTGCTLENLGQQPSLGSRSHAASSVTTNRHMTYNMIIWALLLLTSLQ